MWSVVSVCLLFEWKIFMCIGSLGHLTACLCLGYVAMCIPRDDLLHAYWDIKVCVGLLANVSACVLCVTACVWVYILLHVYCTEKRS